jgi:dTDP-4-dehydrorhamnose reductase
LQTHTFPNEDILALKLLVTGSDGLVGKNILPLLREEFDVVPYVERQWDICNEERGEAIVSRVRPDALLNRAAMTNVDACEDNAELAYRVNSEGAGLLAKICARHETPIMSFSTDYVFDGSKSSPYAEEDDTNPLSVYGRSKREGEQRILANNPRAVIIRTEWVYGDEGESFITKVVRAVRQKGRVEVVNDQQGAPTYAKDLAVPVAALIKQQARGICHVTNDGSCTWYDFARHVFAFLNMDVACHPIATDQSMRRAKRPPYSVLDCTRLRTQTGLTMRTWQAASEEYLNALRVSNRP